jgi:hypothetical protein
MLPSTLLVPLKLALFLSQAIGRRPDALEVDVGFFKIPFAAATSREEDITKVEAHWRQRNARSATAVFDPFLLPASPVA